MGEEEFMNWPTHFVVCGGYDVVDSGITTHGRGGGGMCQGFVVYSPPFISVNNWEW